MLACQVVQEPGTRRRGPCSTSGRGPPPLPQQRPCPAARVASVVAAEPLGAQEAQRTRGPPVPDANPAGPRALAAEQSREQRAVELQAGLVHAASRTGGAARRFAAVLKPDGRRWSAAALTEAYARCRALTARHSKTFYLGTRLLSRDKALAIQAIYAWCRRVDDLVDGATAPADVDKVGGAVGRKMWLEGVIRL